MLNKRCFTRILEGMISGKAAIPSVVEESNSDIKLNLDPSAPLGTTTSKNRDGKLKR